MLVKLILNFGGIKAGVINLCGILVDSAKNKKNIVVKKEEGYGCRPKFMYVYS